MLSICFVASLILDMHSVTLFSNFACQNKSPHVQEEILNSGNKMIFAPFSHAVCVLQIILSTLKLQSATLTVGTTAAMRKNPEFIIFLFLFQK